jgi:hypothetical protein
MLDSLARHPEYLIPLTAILGGTLIAVVAILATQWRMGRRTDQENDLKRDMLGRGMSAEDIERVLRASSGASPPAAPDPVSDNEYYVVEKLVDEGKTTEDIERILRALKAGRSAEGSVSDRIVLRP